MSAIRNILFLFVLSTICFPALAADPSSHMNDYLDAFNEQISADEIARDFFSDRVLFLSVNGVRIFGSHAEFSEWMGSLQKNLLADDWVRTEALESTVCELTDTTAIYGLRFVRVYADGKRVEGSGLYTLAKENDWKIVALSINKSGLLVGCIGDA